MTMMMLEVGGVSIPVDGESTADLDFSRPSSMEATIDNTRWGVSPQRPNLDWVLSWDVSRPDQYAMLLRLVYGDFGRGPFRMVDSTAAATNVLSPAVSLLAPFVENNFTGVTVSGWVALDDGQIAGQHLLASAVSLTPGWSFASVAPASGTHVVGSVYAQSTAPVRVRLLWYSADPADPAVNGPTATRAVAPSGPLTRVNVSAVVPASINPGGGPPKPVARVGLAVLDTVRVTSPAISWTDAMTEWGLGASARHVMLEPPSASTIQALREAAGMRASQVQIRVREGGLP